MNRMIRWGITASLGLSLAPGMALAQTPAPAPTPTPAPAAGSGAMYTKDTYPVSLEDRPLTLPAGTIQVGAAFIVANASIPVPLVGTISETSELLSIGGAYGVTDQLEIEAGATPAGVPFTPSVVVPSLAGGGPLSPVGGFTTFLLHSNQPGGNFWQKDVNLGATYSVLHSDVLDVAPSATFMGNFNSNSAIGEQASYDLALSANTRYKIGQIYVFGGNDLLQIGLRSSFQGSGAPTFINLNVGAGYQLNPNLALQLGTDLAMIKIANASNEFIFKDFIPVGLMGVYGISNKLDAIVGFDYTHFSVSGSSINTWNLLIGANYRI